MAYSRPFIIVILAVFLVSVLRLDLLAKEAERFSISGVDLRVPGYSLRDAVMEIQHAGSDIPFPDSSDFILLAQEDYDGDGIPSEEGDKKKDTTGGTKGKEELSNRGAGIIFIVIMSLIVLGSILAISDPWRTTGDQDWSELR